MNAEVIAIGDELITGQRLDTNTQWLSQQLTDCGVDVDFHTTVGDRLRDNVSVFRAAIERADIVVATGGLGPTADDLTREALAAAVGVELVRDEACLQHIRNLFAQRGREMPERNVVQAEFPVGSSAVPNAHGTAPGISMCIARPERADCWVFALPGVPAELKPMWRAALLPAILALQPVRRVIRHRRVKCFGVGESQMEAMLPDLIARDREPIVGITVSDATITLRVTASGQDEASCLASMEPTMEQIRRTLGDLVFGEEDDELEHAVTRLLAERRQSVAVAEWASGGRIAQWLADAGQGGVVVLRAGLTVTSLEAASRQLGAEPPSGSDSCSSEAAVFLAEAVRSSSGAEFGLGVSAFPPEADAPEARVHVSIATPQRTRRLRFGCASHPAIRRSRTAKQALNGLRLALLGKDDDRQ